MLADYLFRIFYGLVLILLSSCARITPDATPTTTLETNIRIPSQTDWVDHGIILEAGDEGEWDYYLWGGFAFSVVKKEERSEERRVGKECRSRWSTYQSTKKRQQSKRSRRTHNNRH